MTEPAWVPRLTAEVYTRGGDLVTALGDGFDRTWQDPLNEVGSGSVHLANDDTALALVGFAHVLRFSLDGVPCFSSLVEHRDSVILTAAEEVDEITTVAGRGTLAIFEEAVIEPVGGERRSQFEQDRLFNFAAPELDDSAWDPVLTHPQVLDPDTDPGSHNTVPQGWPDPGALKIWQTWPIGDRPATVGDIYARAHFTTTDTATYRVFCTADDGYEVWIDGQYVLGEVTPFIWNETRDTEVVLDGGDHVIAVKGTNLDFSDNVAWVMVTVYALGDGGVTLASVVCHTDADWVAVGYPADPPGFTPAAVVRILVDEAQARGEIPDVVLGFDDAADSDAVPWPVTSDIAFTVGADLLSALKQLAETYMDLAMSPTGLTLNAWVSRGSVTGVALVPGLNLTELAFSGDGAALVTALLCRWGVTPGGYTWVTDDAAIAAVGRRSAYLSVAATSEAEAVRIATAILADRSSPAVGTHASLEPAGAGDDPYIDFAVGDWVTAPQPDGTTGLDRLVSLTVTEDDEGNPVFVPELGSVREERDRANQRALKRMANGSLAGTVESASPNVNPVPTKRKPPTAPIGPFSIPGPVIVAVSGRYYPPTNVLALRLIASLAVAGSSGTTVDLLRNDVVVATVTIAAGDLVAQVTVDVTYGVVDYATVASTAAGAGAEGLVVQIPTV